MLGIQFSCKEEREAFNLIAAYMRILQGKSFFQWRSNKAKARRVAEKHCFGVLSVLIKLSQTAEVIEQQKEWANIMYWTAKVEL